MLPRILLPLFLCLAPCFGQAAADISAEPHHQLLLENSFVRVYSLVLKPQQQALVKHQHNFLLVTLQDSELVIWPEDRSPIQSFPLSKGDVRFVFGEKTLGMRNDRTSEYRAVLVEFLDPNVSTYDYQWRTGQWDFGRSILQSPVDPEGNYADALSLAGATAIGAQLLPGAAYPAPRQSTAELLIPITQVDLNGGELGRINKAPGEVLWIPPGRKFDLRNNAQRARFVVLRFASYR